MQNKKTVAVRVAELALFLVALGFLVPPIPSHIGQVYRPLPAMILGGGFFAGSLALGVWRGGEHWGTAVVKLLAFPFLVWIIHERVFRS